MSWGLCVGVLGRFFFVVYSLVCESGIPFVGCDCMTVDVVDSRMHLKRRSTYLWFFQVAGLVWS